MFIKEQINTNEYHAIEVDHVIVANDTKIQNVKIVEFKNYGKSLLLNDRIQSTEKDEFIYHESLVFPAFSYFLDIKKVLSVGGANGGIERELFKINSLEKIKFIDVDEEASKLARKHLPHMFSKPNNRKTTEYIYSSDPVRVIDNEKTEYWDLIINDFPDVIENNYCSSLYSEHYFNLISSKLTKNGITVFHLGSLNNYDQDFFNVNYLRLKNVFKSIKIYTVYVPSFGCSWILCLCSKNHLVNLNFEKASALYSNKGLRFYDSSTHKRLFNLPKYFRDKLETEIEFLDPIQESI